MLASQICSYECMLGLHKAIICCMAQTRPSDEAQIFHSVSISCVFLQAQVPPLNASTSPTTPPIAKAAVPSSTQPVEQAEHSPAHGSEQLPCEGATSASTELGASISPEVEVEGTSPQPSPAAAADADKPSPGPADDSAAQAHAFAAKPVLDSADDNAPGQPQPDLSSEPAGQDASGAPAQSSDAAVEEDSDGECVVCWANHASIVFSPCGHLCTCASCAQPLLEASLPCPLCRLPICGSLDLL